MAGITDDKLTAFSFNHADQTDQPSPATYNATQLKQKFDSRASELQTKYNALIDALLAIAAGNSGADNVGATAIAGLTGATVQTLLGALKNYTDTHIADYVRNPGYAVDTGVANAYVVTLNPAPTAYVDGMRMIVKITHANTGSPNINVNGLGTKSIYKADGTALNAGDLLSPCMYELVYTSSGYFRLIGGDLDAVKLSGVSLANIASQSTDYTRTPGYAVDTGVANASAVTLDPAPAAYVNGMLIAVKIAATSTSAYPLINVNGLGTKVIYKGDGQNLNTGDLMAGRTYLLCFYDDYFCVLGGDTDAVKLGGVVASNYVTTGALTDHITAVGIPASSTSIGTPGHYAVDGLYLYFCTATNTWKRVAISAW